MLLVFWVFLFFLCLKHTPPAKTTSGEAVAASEVFKKQTLAQWWIHWGVCTPPPPFFFGLGKKTSSSKIPPPPQTEGGIPGPYCRQTALQAGWNRVNLSVGSHHCSTSPDFSRAPCAELHPFVEYGVVLCSVFYTHSRAPKTPRYLGCRLLLEKKKSIISLLSP